MDDLLSWGGEEQTRFLYEKALAHYDETGGAAHERNLE